MKKAHFIGICGVGMSAVAKLLKDAGWEVTGSDAEFYPPVSDHLKAWGISFTEGYSAANIPENVELIVIGKNAKLTEENNEEVARAMQSGAMVRSFAEVLGNLAEETENIVVAGSYGKSTCTSLLTWCLLHAGKDPSYFIGAFAHGIDATTHLGDDKQFILEGDEYPSSNWDDTSKFLFYNPHHVLITAAEHDHVNVFPTQEDFYVPFIELFSLVPKNGVVVVSDEEHIQKLKETYRPEAVTYGLDKDADYAAENIDYGQKTTFDVTLRGKKVITLTTTLLGTHNVQNIVGVAALLLERELLTAEEIAAAIKDFQGVERRLDLKTTTSRVPIYEGFGSSYTKARAAIDAIKRHFPDKKLIIVFEPHTFSWRNRDFLPWYDSVFDDCDTVFVYHPPTQGATTHKQLTLDEIVDRLKQAKVKVTPFDTPKSGLTQIQNAADENSVVLILTSGDLDGLTKSLPQQFDELFTK